MKKLILTIAILTAGFMMSAQTKGDMYISGSLSISGGGTKSSLTVNAGGNSTTKKTSSPLSTDFSIAPEFGYFIIDNLAIEGSVSYGINKSLNNSVSTTEKNYFDYTHSFTINPGARYYIRLGNDKFYYTPGAHLAFGFSQEIKRVDKDTTTKPKAPFLFGLSIDLLAFEFKPAAHFGIMLKGGSFDWHLMTVSTKESVSNAEAKASVTTNTASLQLSSSLSLGFKYYF